MTRSNHPRAKDDAEQRPTSGEIIVCGKCGHENKPHTSSCADCGAHLHIVCHQCGHRNLRSAAACVECGKRLHRSFWQKWSKRLFRRQADAAPLQIALLIVAVYFGYKLIVWLSRYNPPTPE